MYLATAEQMRQIDKAAIEGHGIPSLDLMENAGRGIAERISTGILSHSPSIIAIICGNGNNGGDGFVIARYLLQAGHSVTAHYFGPDDKLSLDCAANLKRAIESGVPVHQISDIGNLSFRECDLIVDAIFGTGFSGAPRKPHSDLIERINAQDKLKVSVDLPSGLNADNGQHEGAVIKADYTFTLALPKYGLYVSPGRELAGEVEVIPIGIPDSIVDDCHLYSTLTTPDIVTSSLPSRATEGHKGTFGKLLVVAGSLGLTGAAALASRSALRSGCGLVRVACPASALPIIASLNPEPTTHPLPEIRRKGALALRALGEIRVLESSHDACVIGPGLGLHHETIELVRRLVETVARPAVIDADALTAIAKDSRILKSRSDTPLILTPHAGEFKRISGEEAPSDVQKRIESARRFAEEFNVTLVLKGSPTLTASRDGRVTLNPTGNHGMATGGSGDVLSGIIGSLLAQGMEASEAAVAGVYIHGLAGDLAADMLTPRSVIASDILENIPDALALLEA